LLLQRLCFPVERANISRGKVLDRGAHQILCAQSTL
jgi:hypothetical protein